MDQHFAPPAYTEAPVSAPATSEQNQPQNPGYNQEQVPYMVQGYNFGQGYPVVQPTYLANPGCTQIFYTCQPPATTDYVNYRSRQSTMLGAAQIVIGILCIIFNSVLIGVAAEWSFGVVAHGIWGGMLFMLTGSFGMLGGKKKAKCAIVTYLILCIFSTLAAATIFILAIIGLVSGSYEYSTYNYYNYNYYYYYDSRYKTRPDNYGAAMAMGILLVILSVIVGCLSIWGSTLGCRVSCCNGSQITYATAPIQFQPVNGNHQVLFVTPPAPAPQYVPQYPDYPMQMAMQAPPYQPPTQPVGGQTNQGFTGESGQKNPMNPMSEI